MFSVVKCLFAERAMCGVPTTIPPTTSTTTSQTFPSGEYISYSWYLIWSTSNISTS